MIWEKDSRNGCGKAFHTRRIFEAIFPKLPEPIPTETASTEQARKPPQAAGKRPKISKMSISNTYKKSRCPMDHPEGTDKIEG